MKKFGIFLSVGMLITGTVNTIFTKLQDRQSVGKDEEGKDILFSHPYFQTLMMFLGEVLCLIAYHLSSWWQKRKLALDGAQPPKALVDRKSFPKLIFLPASLCDCTATTLMNIGLLSTSSSIYQMLRSAMVLTTAAFGVMWLKRVLILRNYVGIFFVMAGVALVGLSGVLFPDPSAVSSGSGKAWVGDLLILSAQVVVAIQFTYEEKFIGKYNVPALQAVGWEGVWGTVILLIALPALQFIKLDGKPIEDSWEAMQQTADDWKIMLSTWGSILSIAFFNYFGISVTKYASATHRTTIDSCRTLFIWAFTLAVKWEKFQYLQLIGFVLLVYGTFLYNHVINLPALSYLQRGCRCLPLWCFTEVEEEHGDDDERKRLLDSGEESIQGERARPGRSGRLPRVGSFEDVMSSDVESPPPPGARSPAQLRLRYYQKLHEHEILNVPHFVVESLGNFRELDGAFILSKP